MAGISLRTLIATPSELPRFFDAWAAKAEVPVILVHATRRTRASLLVALDVHPRVAMTMLRHSKIAARR